MKNLRKNIIYRDLFFKKILKFHIIKENIKNQNNQKINKLYIQDN